MHPDNGSSTFQSLPEPSLHFRACPHRVHLYNVRIAKDAYRDPAHVDFGMPIKGPRRPLAPFDKNEDPLHNIYHKYADTCRQVAPAGNKV